MKRTYSTTFAIKMAFWFGRILCLREVCTRSDNSFFRNIEEEVIQNVKRLSGHPCLALWCGNNEIEVAWKNWGWQKQYKYSEEDSIIIWANYKNFFHYVFLK